jgi:hypothetical protein
MGGCVLWHWHRYWLYHWEQIMISLLTAFILYQNDATWEWWTIYAVIVFIRETDAISKLTIKRRI